MSDTVTTKNNNAFALLRLVLALVVLVDHVRKATDNWFPIDLGWFPPGTLALFGFFSISGYLVTPGIEKFGLKYFTFRRIARIFPGWWGLQIFTVLVFATTWEFQRNNWGLGFFARIRYLLINLVPLPQPPDSISTAWNQLGGLPDNVPLSGRVNVSLWSLALELVCYAGLAFVFFVSRRSKNGFKVAIVATLVLIWVFGTLVSLSQDQVWVQSTNLLQAISLKWPYFLAFFSGVAVRLFEVEIRMSKAVWWLCAILILISIENITLWAIFGSLALTVIVLKTGMLRPPNWLNPRRDLSYGTYLYHFPIHQTIIGFFGVVEPWTVVAISVPTTLFLAYLSSRYVEVPFAKLINKFASRF